MTDITEQAQSHELLIANGNETANLLRHLADNEIDSDYFAVVSECESYGRETEAELSITDFALRAACYVDELVEALEKAQAQSSKWLEAYHKAVSIGARYEERIAELESQVKFPGVMRCNTCGFSRSHVIVTPGGMLAGESEPERCPNGCGPLWHDTYRRQYNELYDAYKELESRTVKLPNQTEFDDPLSAYEAIQKCKEALTAAGIKWEGE